MNTRKQHLARIALLLVVATCLTSCVGLDYPDYWNTDDALLINARTLPIELLLTPLIFVIKLLPNL